MGAVRYSGEIAQSRDTDCKARSALTKWSSGLSRFAPNPTTTTSAAPAVGSRRMGVVLGAASMIATRHADDDRGRADHGLPRDWAGRRGNMVAEPALAVNGQKPWIWVTHAEDRVV